MPPVTADGQSYMIGGRRRWIVAAAVHYARIPSQQWRARLLDAKQAGFNAILAPVVWSHHEALRGRPNFEADRDLRRFVELIGELGMLCILRVGPHVGGMYDRGGLPAWVDRQPESRDKPVGAAEGPRSSDPVFLDACAKWLRAVAQKVRDLQASTPSGGPLALVQIEHEWFCGDDEQAQAYLGELQRFLRENGIQVPFVNANNLFPEVEGSADCWSGGAHLLATMRQLRAVRPELPPMLLEFNPGSPPVFGRPDEAPSPEELQRSLAEAMAAGAQLCVSTFCPGTNFAFLGGRSRDPRLGFASADAGGARAVLGEGGVRGPSFGLIKRLATFASQFERVMANLDESHHPIVAAPGPAAQSVAVTHLRGSRGSVVFALTNGKPANGGLPLLLPNGAVIEAHPGAQRAAWCLLDVHLVGRSTLDYCGFNALAQVGSAFVCFGPAGAKGALSINGSAFEASAPSGPTPLVEEHEGVFVVVLSEEQADAAVVTDDAIWVGVAGVDEDGAPRAHEKFRTAHRIGADGAVERISMKPAPARGRTPSLADWRMAPASAWVDGSHARFAPVRELGELAELGAPYGYGWLRVRVKNKAARRVRLGLFEMADRAHLFIEGQCAAIAGVGEGAEGATPTVQLRKGEQTITLLLDNMGRAPAGTGVPERKGLWGPIWDPKPFAAGKAKIEVGAPLDPLAVRTPLMGLRRGDRTDGRRATWSFMHRRKSPIFLCLAESPSMGVVLLNDEPVAMLEAHAPATIRLTPEALRAGKNTVQVALTADPYSEASVESALDAITKGAAFFEGAAALTEGAELAFAAWEPPAAAEFGEVAKSSLSGRRASGGLPAWWRCAFDAPGDGRELAFDATGLSKGQLFLNGRNLCRYWVSTQTGKAVGPRTQFWLPSPWMRKTANELTVFDEHGAGPGRCRLVWLD